MMYPALGLAGLAALAPMGAVADSLSIAFAGHYPPYLVLQNDRRDGLDSALLDDFCAAGGHLCNWIDLPLDQAIAAVAAGSVNILAGGVGITAERAEIVDFTCPYYAIDGSDGELYALFQDADPADGAVAVSRGSIYERAVMSAGFDPKGYDREAEAALAMLTGEAAVFFGNPVVVDELSNGTEIFYLGSLPTETTGPAFAVSPNAPDLLKALNDFLADRSARGRLSELQVRWLGLDQGDIIATCTTKSALS